MNKRLIYYIKFKVKNYRFYEIASFNIETGILKSPNLENIINDFERTKTRKKITFSIILNG